MTLVCLGLRVSELCGLNLEDTDLDRGNTWIKLDRGTPGLKRMCSAIANLALLSGTEIAANVSALRLITGRRYNVFRNAINAVLSSGVRLRPKGWPLTARVVTL